MFSSIDNLREISRRCLSGEPLSEDLARWLGKSLGDFLSRHCRSLEDALGLNFPQGGIPWWMEEAIRKRDAALRELADRFYTSLSPYAQARQICTTATRYAASAWRFDGARVEMPGRYSGSANEYLWRAFKAGAAMPLCERQLRNILAR